MSDRESDPPPFEIVTKGAPEIDALRRTTPLPVSSSGGEDVCSASVVMIESPHGRDFDDKFAKWSEDNKRSLCAYAFSKTRAELPDAERKKIAEDIVSQARLYFYRRQRFPTIGKIREKIVWLAQDLFKKAEFRRGNQQVPASLLGGRQPDDDGNETSDEEVYSGSAKAGWEWLQQIFESPAEAAVHSDLQHRVRDTVERLPKKQRSYIKLHWFDDIPVTEIARQFGETSQNINHHLRKAKAALRKALKPFLS